MLQNDEDGEAQKLLEKQRIREALTVEVRQEAQMFLDQEMKKMMENMQAEFER